VALALVLESSVAGACLDQSLEAERDDLLVHNDCRQECFRLSGVLL
jgi:hypothetical protein